MMIRRIRGITIAVALLGIAAFGNPRSAHAALTLTLSSPGDAPIIIVEVGDADAVSFTGDIGEFHVTIAGGVSNEPGLATLGQLTYTQFFVENTNANGGASAADTITATLTDDGFTAPLGDVTVTSAITGSTTGGTGNSAISFQSFIDGVPVGALAQTISSSTGLGENTRVGLYTTAGSYTLKNVTSATVGFGGSLLSTGVTTVAPAVPEPATLVSVILALPLIGAGTWFRRRKQS